MTPIPERPKHIPETMYKQHGDIIIEDFIYKEHRGWQEWRCDKCEDYGSGSSDGNQFPDQLYLWEIPVQETDGYRFAYLMAQQHYQWAHEGDYRRTNDCSPEFQKILEDAYAQAAIETEPEWVDTWRKTKMERFHESLGIETYHGKHRLEDHKDMPAAREVHRLFLCFHQATVNEYKDSPRGSWQRQAWFWSEVQLARGYYPYKRKQHRK